ncbi:MAG: 3-phosphoshikimate 1-carboxyvinyltransferase [Pirellula sp.]|nr:3-phosphoshikimate 1-carboxyvinyltransferase [Pirellula sp.]
MTRTSHQPVAVSISPVVGPVSGTVRVPGSKSITNRAIICAAMARGESVLSGVLDSEDTRVMVDAWRTLGLEIEWDLSFETLRIVGCAGHPPQPNGALHIANSGTSIRFLTAALSATRGNYRLDGVPRMRERPIADLLDGLRALGANVQSENTERPDCPPVRIMANGLHGGVAKVAGNVSSQFLSGMMMASPYADSPIEIEVVGELVSKPYVSMTAMVMKSFGLAVETLSDSRYRIAAPECYRGCSYAIEPDASAATYFWAAAAITEGRVRVEGLDFDAMQGDVGFVRVLEKMGCEVSHGRGFIEVTGRPMHGIDVDMNAISDTVQSLAPAALFANGPTRIRGVAHNRHKETDRIGDLATELRKVGAQVDEHDDGLTIHPLTLRSATLDTYHDHRMAMSLALIGLKVPGIRILDPQCTTKTFPKYFEVLGELIQQNPNYEFAS